MLRLRIPRGKMAAPMNHHKQSNTCPTRPHYRNPRHERAVKVYTINQESRFLLVFNVPALGVVKDLLELFALYGEIEEYSLLDEYPCEPYTDVYMIKFREIEAAKKAKSKLDNHYFFSKDLHVCYAPEYETVQDTREKLNKRRTMIRRSKKNLQPISHTNTRKVLLPAPHPLPCPLPHPPAPPPHQPLPLGLVPVGPPPPQQVPLPPSPLPNPGPYHQPHPVGPSVIAVAPPPPSHLAPSHVAPSPSHVIAVPSPSQIASLLPQLPPPPRSSNRPRPLLAPPTVFVPNGPPTRNPIHFHGPPSPTPPYPHVPVPRPHIPDPHSNNPVPRPHIPIPRPHVPVPHTHVPPSYSPPRAHSVIVIPDSSPPPLIRSSPPNHVRGRGIEAPPSRRGRPLLRTPVIAQHCNNDNHFSRSPPPPPPPLVSLSPSTNAVQTHPPPLVSDHAQPPTLVPGSPSKFQSLPVRPSSSPSHAHHSRSSGALIRNFDRPPLMKEVVSPHTAPVVSHHFPLTGHSSVDSTIISVRNKMSQVFNNNASRDYAPPQAKKRKRI